MQLAHVAGKIPESHKAQLQRIGETTGKTESELVREAIAAYLGKTEPESVEKMSRRLAQLERQVKTLIMSQS
jgi:predicted DNA-binding protein